MPRGKITSSEKLAVELYKLKWGLEELTFRKLLQILYIEKGYTVEKVAEALYVSKGKAYYILRDYGIPARYNRKKRLKC